MGHATAPLTRQEIFDRWPNPATRPSPNTLWRWLTRACELGILVRSGSGSRNDAHRYGLVNAPPQESAA